MDALPDAVFTIGMPDRRIEFVNERVRDVFGHPPEAVLGQTTRMFYGDDAAYEAFGHRLNRCLDEGRPGLRSEELLVRADGHPIHCEVSVVFERRAGELVGVVASVRSIEERWQAQKSLRDRSEQWDRFFSLTSNMLWNWDFASDSVERSDAFQTALGYAKDEIAPAIQWWVDRVHPDDRARVMRTFEQALETGAETTGYTYRIRRRDGSYATVRDRVVLMRDESGQAYRALGAMTDITEQVRRDEQARRANNLESLGLLAGGIAHDFNNQLTGVMALAEMIALDAEDPPEVRSLAKQIVQAVESSAQLTRQLLTFSKGGAPSVQTVSLEELVRKHATFALTGSSTRVTFRFDAELWPARVDPGQIAQVIQNLVINADQAMERRGELLIEARNLDGSAGDETRYLELRVTDQGPGIGPEAMRRVFDPYFTTKSTGHGLGLSICHSIVERHEGSIQVESTLGEGATFIVQLPATDESPGKVDAGPELIRGSARVLVVDDLPEVRRTLKRLLTALGYRADTVADVDQAAATMAEARDDGDPYEVVITDLTIPGTAGGLEVLRLAKAADPSVRVVVASGYANDPVLSDHRAHGFDGKLTKPIRLRMMSTVLASVLEG